MARRKGDNMDYIISDNHFNHEAIIGYESRPFASVKEMNEYMIKKWNSVISNKDTIYHVGDFAWGNFEAVQAILSRLNGRKILIKGNHDEHKSDTWWKRAGFDDVISGGIIKDKFYFITHEPMYMNEHMPYVNIHGHLHSQEYKSSQYFNVSVELHDYTPILWNTIKEIYEKDVEERGEGND